jgi:alkylhydroperoxidase family enzyme
VTGPETVVSKVGFVSEDVDLDLVERITADRGWVPNIFRVLMFSPPLAEGWVSLANAFRGPCELDKRSRELAILLIAHLKNSAYEWRHHESVAGSVGISAGEIDALRNWPDRAEWTADEWALLSLVASTTLHLPVPESCVATLVRSGGERRVVEIAGLAAYYTAVSHFSAAMDIDVDEQIR